jgi:hypothetical protein
LDSIYDHTVIYLIPGHNANKLLSNLTIHHNLTCELILLEPCTLFLALTTHVQQRNKKKSDYREHDRKTMDWTHPK